jgi:hypothetical protein
MPTNRYLIWSHVSRDVAVKRHKQLTAEEKQVGDEGIGDDFGQGLDLFPSRIEIGHPPDDEAQQDQQGRPRGKGRGQKARRQDGRQPEVAPGQAAVQKGCHGVDADGEGNGKVNQGLHPHGIMGAVAFGLQHVPADHQIENR